MGAAILVTGGTGTLGRRVVPLLVDAVGEIRVLTRRAREPAGGVEYPAGDLVTGAGIEDAVRDVLTVVHLAGTAKGDDVKARNLLNAIRESRSGVRHLVFVSVVGADRIPVKGRMDRMMFGYFAAKRAAEILVEDSGIGWTTLRATQFYDSLGIAVRAMSRSPVVPVPSISFQPVDTAEVAARLVDASLNEPAGLLPEMGGPATYPMRQLVRSYLRATGRRRLLVPVRPGGAAARAIRAGANLAADGTVGVRTWEEFLAEQSRSTVR